MNAQPKEQFVSEEEFLKLVEASEQRLELVGGQVYAMAGGELDHSRAIDNVAAALKAGLRGKPCRASGSNFHIRVEETKDWFIPDNAIYCEDARFVRKPFRALLDPVVIFEVLSLSTEKVDRTSKFDAYKTIPTFQEYVLISLDFVRVEQFSRQSNGWLQKTFTRLEDVVELPLVDLSLRVADIYDELDVPIQLTLVWPQPMAPASEDDEQ